MNPDPTITISWDYFIEFTDDGTQPDQPEPQVIILPPGPNGAESTPKPLDGPAT